MEDDADYSDYLEKRYVDLRKLNAASRQVPEVVWTLLDKALRDAEADNSPAGIHWVLLEMISQPYVYESTDHRNRIVELAEFYADLVHDNPQRLRYLAVAIYRDLHNVPLALRYVENAMKQSIENLRHRSVDMIGFGIHDLLETMRLELYIYADANLDGERTKQLLSQLSLLVQEFQVHDEFLLDALLLLAERKLVSRHHIGLIVREKFNMERRGVDVQKVAKLDTILAEIRDMPDEEETDSED